jgi:two-component system, NtrC family, response regulator AtoC
VTRDYTTLEFPAIEQQGGALRAFLVVYHGQRTRIVDVREGQEVTFGRSRQATVEIEDQSVSRLHAAVVRREGCLHARDLGSRNGTRCNGVPLAGEHRLAAGDELTIGTASVVVGITSKARRHAPTALGTFMERLAAEADRANRYRRRLSLLMVRFEGPEAAVAVSRQRIATVLRRMDCMTEYGTAEIGVLLPETEREGALATAYRLRRQAENEDTTVVVGVAVYPDEARDADELVERAREALMVARRGEGDAGVAAAPPRAARERDSLVVLDPAMQRVFELAQRVAQTDITVLLQGETGVGKDVVAEEIHRRGPRANGPFVRLNCASLPETLLESELFGSERGAFTGADRRRQGYFEAASTGTLLLDEIGELPEGTQVKLLRVLETHTIVRLGDTQETPVDVRVIAATNLDLEAQVGRGRFREDLFYRLSAFTVHVPPLRDRRSEIVPLCKLFATEIASRLGVQIPEFTPAALAALAAHAWPGNVRELRNVIERAVVLCSGTIGVEELPDRLRAAAGAGPLPDPSSDAIRDRVAAVERRTIEEALGACSGNQTKAAKRLGLSRRALIYKMEKHGLKPPPAKE